MEMPVHCGAPVCIAYTVGDDASRVVPLVKELLENAAVAVLRREGRAEHLVPHRHDFPNDGRVVAVPIMQVHERATAASSREARRPRESTARVVASPPAAVEVQVAEFVRQHACLVLVRAREKSREPFDLPSPTTTRVERIGVSSLDHSFAFCDARRARSSIRVFFFQKVRGMRARAFIFFQKFEACAALLEDD